MNIRAGVDLDIFFLLLPWLNVRQFITDRTTLTGRLPFFAPVNHRLIAFQSKRSDVDCLRRPEVV
jgi:hypothetical protein